MPLVVLVRGSRGTVSKFVRSNGRCPAAEFLDGCEERMRKRFEGSFGAAVNQGLTYQNGERFTPLHEDGKPLWEFKEHDHRLYCYRNQNGNFIDFVLFSGWVKQKGGKNRKEEPRRIKAAKQLYREYLAEPQEERNGISTRMAGVARTPN